MEPGLIKSINISIFPDYELKKDPGIYFKKRVAFSIASCLALNRTFAAHLAEDKN